MQKIVLVVFFTFYTLFDFAQDWMLKLSSNVEIRTWKLTTKADKEQIPLFGASIKLFKGASVINSVASDNNGDFTIMVPPDGDFILEVSYGGCNTKRFAISTQGVPENVGKDNYKPSFSIGGFIMAKPFPGIDYSELQKTLVKVEYKPKGKNFDHDDIVTDSGLNIVARISNAESVLIENFCSTNRDGDAALAKPDCPLAKMLYEKAISIIPGEQYPVIQLAKVGLCLKEQVDAVKKAETEKLAKEKEAADKLVKEKAAADKAEADKLSKEKETAAKAEADKLAKEKAEADKIAREKAVAEKGEADKLAKEKAAAEKAEEIKANKEKLANAKAEKEKALADKKAAEKAERDKLIAERTEREKALAGKVILPKEEKNSAPKEKEDVNKKAEREKLTKEKEAKERAEADHRAARKAEVEKEEAERLAKDREGKVKKFEYETKHGKESGEMDKGNSYHRIPQVLGPNKYKEAITRADDYFKTKRYKEAKEKYEEALKIKENDTYANSKLITIEKILSTK